jgi:hypothetical protein
MDIDLPRRQNWAVHGDVQVVSIFIAMFSIAPHPESPTLRLATVALGKWAFAKVAVNVVLVTAVTVTLSAFG